MITYEQAKRTLLELVDENGFDYQYPHTDEDCVYSTAPDDGSQPSCIVGHLVAKLDPEAFKEIAKNEWNFEEVEVDDYDNIDETTYEERWVPDPLSALELIQSYEDTFDSDDRMIRLLEVAQSIQDTGRPWGQAVNEAIKTAEGL